MSVDVWIDATRASMMRVTSLDSRSFSPIHYNTDLTEELIHLNKLSGTQKKK